MKFCEIIYFNSFLVHVRFCWSFMHSTPMIDALAHSLLCHLSLYLLTSKSFDLLMTLLQCKLSVCLHGFFVPFHIAIIHPTEKKKKKKKTLALAWRFLVFATLLT